MIKCPECGAEQASENPKFCFECGHRFGEASSPAPAESIEEKLEAFLYDDLGNGRYSIRKLKDKFAESVEIPEGVVEIGVIAFSNYSIKFVLIWLIVFKGFIYCHVFKRVEVVTGYKSTSFYVFNVFNS